MNEEEVTKSILSKLKSDSWTIISFDFPQSGTGKTLHPNESSNKNEGSIIPDIITIRNNTCIIFENKSFCCKNDFDKLYNMKMKQNYSQSLEKLLKGHDIKNYYYIIGMPILFEKKITPDLYLKVDAVYLVDENRNVKITTNSKNVSQVLNDTL